jgi:hypothetical protein
VNVVAAPSGLRGRDLVSVADLARPEVESLFELADVQKAMPVSVLGPAAGGR